MEKLPNRLDLFIDGVMCSHHASKDVFTISPSECSNGLLDPHLQEDNPAPCFDPGSLVSTCSPSVIGAAITAANELSPNLRSFSMSATSELSEVVADLNSGPSSEDTSCHISYPTTLPTDGSNVRFTEGSCVDASEAIPESVHNEKQCHCVSTSAIDASVSPTINSSCPSNTNPSARDPGVASFPSPWLQSNTNGSYPSELAGQAFRGASALARPVILSGPPLDNISKKTSVSRTPCSSPTQAHFCNLCGKQYRHGASLRNHMRKHESGVLASKRYRCPHCIYSSQYNRNVTKHIDSTHKNFDAFYPTCTNVISQSMTKQNFSLKEEQANGTSSVNWNPQLGADQTLRLSDQIPAIGSYVRSSSSNSLRDCHLPVSKKVLLQKSSQELDSTVVPAFSGAPLEKPLASPIGSQYHTCSRKPYRCDVPGCVRTFKTLRYLTNHLNDFHGDNGYKCSPMDCNPTNKAEPSSMNTYSGRRNSLQELLSPEVYDSKGRFKDRRSPDFGFPAVLAPLDSCHQAPPTKRQHSETDLSDLNAHESFSAYSSYSGASHFDSSRPVITDVYSFPGPNFHSLPNPQTEPTLPFRSIDPRGIGEHVTEQPSVQFVDSRSSGFSTFHHTGSRDCVQSQSCSLPTVTPTCLLNKAGLTGSSSGLHSDKFLVHGCIETPHSTVEQLLCAPDMSNDETQQLTALGRTKLPDIFHGEPAVNDPQTMLFTSSHLSGYCDFGTSGKDSADPTQYCSSTPTADSDSLVQSQLNSEADAFFSDLEEILAREQPLFERDTPNTNPASTDCKESAHRSSESSVRSPMVGPNVKLISTASLLSGDSGLESWSSSSSCSAGPNSASLWGSQDGTVQMKASPLATTPQPATSVSATGACNHRQQGSERTPILSQVANGLLSTDSDVHNIRPTTQADLTFSDGYFSSQTAGLYLQMPSATLDQSLHSQERMSIASEHTSFYGQSPDAHANVTGDFLNHPSCVQFASTETTGERICEPSVSCGPTFTGRVSFSVLHDSSPKQDVHYADSSLNRPEILSDMARASITSNPAAASVSPFVSQLCEFPDRPATGMHQLRGRKNSPCPLTDQNFEHAVNSHPKLLECGPMNPYGAHENGPPRTSLVWPSMPSYPAPYNSTGIPYTSRDSTFYEAHNQKTPFTSVPPDSKLGRVAVANPQSHHPQSSIGYVSMDRGYQTTLHNRAVSVSEKLSTCNKTAWPSSQFVNTAYPSDCSHLLQHSQVSRASYFTSQMYESGQHHTQLPYPAEPFIPHQLRYNRTATPDASFFVPSQRNVSSYHNSPTSLPQLEQQYACRGRNYYPPSSQPGNCSESKSVRPFKLYCQRLASSLRTVPCSPDSSCPVGFDNVHALSRNPCLSTRSTDSNIASWSNVDQSLVSDGTCAPRDITVPESPCSREPQSLFFRRNFEADLTHSLDSNPVMPFNNSGVYNQPPTGRISQYTESMAHFSSMPVDSLAVEPDNSRDPREGLTSTIQPDPTMYIHHNPGVSAVHNDWSVAPLSESVETSNIPQLSIDRQFGMSCPSQIIS